MGLRKAKWAARGPKREQAIARQAIYNLLTIHQKIESLDKHNYVAAKQRRKLNQQLEVK